VKKLFIGLNNVYRTFIVSDKMATDSDTVDVGCYNSNCSFIANYCV